MRLPTREIHCIFKIERDILIKGKKILIYMICNEMDWKFIKKYATVRRNYPLHCDGTLPMRFFFTIEKEIHG